MSDSINDDDLICVYCKKIFQSSPLTLVPCGWVICSSHFDEYNGILVCRNCCDLHVVYKNECFSTKSIEIKYENYKLEKSIKQIKTDINELEQIKKEPESYIYEHFSNLINQADIQREQIKILIDQYFDRILDYLNLTKEEHVSKIVEKTNFQNFDLESFQNHIEIVKNILNRNTDLSNDDLDTYSIIIGSYKNKLKDILKCLTGHRNFELTEISPDIECDNIFGKLIIEQKQKYPSSKIDLNQMENEK
ncbi:unnamed protein product [Brachionus calyciflorus]|uniref:Uncharacterized protein n=1 Tax=Brachionus calyciflorus TaxID=104777 RepID=A0A813YTX3_9BILA|nr:unnamed protein product [Brachionus calyciflorus]